MPLNNSETRGHKDCRNLGTGWAGDGNLCRDTSEQAVTERVQSSMAHELDEDCRSNWLTIHT